MTQQVNNQTIESNNITTNIMQAVGTILEAKTGTATAAIKTANAGAMADKIVAHLVGHGNDSKGHTTLCETLRETFKAMDEEQFFHPTAIEMQVVMMKDSSITGDDLRKKVNKARKQTAFRLFRNAFARFDKERNGDKQVYQLESKGYMFVITQAKEEAKKKGFDKWLSDGAKWLPQAEIDKVVQARTAWLESLKAKEQEQEQKAMSIRQEVAAMTEQSLQEKALHLLELTGVVEPSDEQIASCMERLQVANG